MKKIKKLNTKEIAKLCHRKSISQIEKVLCGELLGRGMYRDVFVLKQNPNYVVKIERDPGTGQFCNVMEYRNYQNNKEWKFLAEWLAPCELINETGQVMIQRRVNWDGKRRKDYPKYIPVPFTDLKLVNFGWMDGRFVCCDYAYIPIFFVVTGKNSFKYANWRGSLNHLQNGRKA